MDFINNQDNIDKHVQFDETPDGEDDEDARVDPDIEREEENEPVLDNRNATIPPFSTQVLIKYPAQVTQK